MTAYGSQIAIGRIYEVPARSSAARLLVDRLWPRGVSRCTLQLDAWLPEVAPSAVLRQWFRHDPSKWIDFQHRYTTELKDNPEAVDRCLTWLRKGPILLLYGARDVEHNHAVVLRQHLLSVMISKGAPA